MMVFIQKENNLLIEQGWQKTQMKTHCPEDNGECEYSSNISYNINLRQRKTKEKRRNSHEPTTLKANGQRSICNPDQNSNTIKETGEANMNADSCRTGNTTLSQPPSSTFEPNIRDATSCYKLQEEFRRCGWNVAGANLLAVSCYVSKCQFLYARPRLTGLDFVIASIITATCGVLASLLSWFLLENDSPEQILHAASLDATKVNLELPLDSPSSSTNYYIFPIIGVLAAVAGGAYLLCKVSQWQPMENIIQRQMGRPLQREFVSTLVQVCQEENIDPENIDDLLEISERTGFRQLHVAMVDFFKSRLKMQE